MTGLAGTDTRSPGHRLYVRARGGSREGGWWPLDRTVINVEPAGCEEASCGQRHISWKGWIRLIGRAPVALGKGCLLGSDKARQIGSLSPTRGLQ